MRTYLLAMYQPDGPAPTEEQLAPVMRDLSAVTQDLSDVGALVFNGALHAPGAATTVRSASGVGTLGEPGSDETLLTDGPFAEAKEFLGGLWIIRVADLDDALGYARRLTAATTLPVEVRPFHG